VSWQGAARPARQGSSCRSREDRTEAGLRVAGGSLLRRQTSCGLLRGGTGRRGGTGAGRRREPARAQMRRVYGGQRHHRGERAVRLHLPRQDRRRRLLFRGSGARGCAAPLGGGDGETGARGCDGCKGAVLGSASGGGGSGRSNCGTAGGGGGGGGGSGGRRPGWRTPLEWQRQVQGGGRERLHTRGRGVVVGGGQPARHRLRAAERAVHASHAPLPAAEGGGTCTAVAPVTRTAGAPAGATRRTEREREAPPSRRVSRQPRRTNRLRGWRQWARGQ